MNLESLPIQSLSVEIGCVLLILFLFLVDLALPQEGKNWIAALSMAGILLLSGALVLRWGKPGFVLEGMVRLDSYSSVFQAIFLLAAFLTSVMTKEFLSLNEKRVGEFFILILSALFGMILLASAYDFILLFLAIELVSLSFYVMTAFLRTDARAIEAGIKYLILSSLASALMLYGISFIYGHVGSTGFGALKEFLENTGKTPVGLIFGIVLLISGLAFKVGAVPFHLWIPDVYEGAPLPVTAYLSVGSKAAGFAVVMRLLGEILSPVEARFSWAIGILAAMTLLYGNLGAIPQQNVKRLLAYSSIGHAGYLLVGIAAGSRLGGEAFLFYLIAYAVTNLAAFLAVTAASRALGSDDLSAYRGLSERSPFLAATLFISLLSLAGVPPLAGFFGKFLILTSAVQSNLFWLAIWGAINIVISLYYYLMVIKRMYIDRAADKNPIPLSLPVRISLALTVLGIVGIGSFQEPFLGLATSAASQLF